MPEDPTLREFEQARALQVRRLVAPGACARCLSPLQHAAAWGASAG